MSLLRRRRKLEPVPSSVAPPADGAAPCLDAFSRRRGAEPIAGVFVDWATAEHYGGVRLTPYDPEAERALKVAAKAAKKYRNALRELAK